MTPVRRHFDISAWGWKVLAPALAVFILFTGIPDIPESISAARNEGSSGTFTSVRSECSVKGGCTYYGRFVSDDHAVNLKNVFIDDGVQSVGESVPAQYFERAAGDKVYEFNSRDWVWLGLFLVGSVLYLGGWAWLVVRPWIRKRAR